MQTARAPCTTGSSAPESVGPVQPPSPILLAAGASRRLGACKALVRLRDEEPGTPLGLAIAAARGMGSVDRLLVVAGAHHAELQAATRHSAEVELVHNTDWALGRTGSVACAVRARPGRDLCLLAADVPLVTGELLSSLAHAWGMAGAPARGWLAPWVKVDGARRHGHPIVVGRELLSELLVEDTPDRPLRAWRAAAEPLLELEVQDAAILDDLDDPNDLRALRARLERRA